jgi:3-hydroxyisobutyrate dehydrogenase-like beta-hydroxyacid dehydrogenase
MNICFIGFGEVGYEMSKGFIEEGIQTIYVYDYLYDSDIVQNRVRETKVTLCRSYEEVFQHHIDILFLAVPAHQSNNVWGKISHLLNNETIFVDVTTSSAKEKRDVFEKLMKEEKRFVDAAMMGPLTIHKHKVPINASGNGAELFQKLMIPFNMNISIVGDEPGDATNIKFIRSIYMKGISALLIEVLTIAYELGLEDVVLNSISESMEELPFEKITNRLVKGSATHSARRVIEMENVIKFLKENGKDSTMATATRDKLKWLTDLELKEKFNQAIPDDWKEIFKELSEGGIIK